MALSSTDNVFTFRSVFLTSYFLNSYIPIKYSGRFKNLSSGVPISSGTHKYSWMSYWILVSVSSYEDTFNFSSSSYKYFSSLAALTSASSWVSAFFCIVLSSSCHRENSNLWLSKFYWVVSREFLTSVMLDLILTSFVDILTLISSLIALVFLWISLTSKSFTWSHLCEERSALSIASAANFSR